MVTLSLIVMLISSTTTAIGTVAGAFNPSMLLRETQITILRQQLADAEAKIRRLEEHNKALDDYEKQKAQWEANERFEAADREAQARWRDGVALKLDEIEEACRAR